MTEQEVNITECRAKLHARIAAAVDEWGVYSAVVRLVEFERLDALAHQPCQWCDENPCKEWDECYGPNKTAERLLAELVAAVLAEDAANHRPVSLRRGRARPSFPGCPCGLLFSGPMEREVRQHYSGNDEETVTFDMAWIVAFARQQDAIVRELAAAVEADVPLLKRTDRLYDALAAAQA